ncbi:MAG: methyltransferase domain-containing protein [Burkholderiaceae bacterium]|nr:methyltransferase domain-containing protein [Burkholderiaceae bacterium]
MTQSKEALHVYLRNIQAHERTSLSVLAHLIDPGSTLLDLGCGSGALGAFLKNTRQCIADGVTWSPAEAEHARCHYRRVEIADLEQVDLPALFAGQRYDAIVCADVLEHLRQPEKILAACRTLLAPRGQLLISVPNAAYCGLLAELLHGEFRYRDEGLLDRTHLRFFTRRSLARFMAEQDWDLAPLDTIRRELPESEFKIAFDHLPPAVSRYLLAVPDALTYQFIGSARPRQAAGNAPVETGAPTTPREPAQALFTAQLYVGTNEGFSEDHKLSQAGVIGQHRQVLRFELPCLLGTEAPRLRLDPADRPGFLHLHRLLLRDAQGQVPWQWDAATDSVQALENTAHQQILWRPPLPTASDCALLLLAGDDPWFELPIPPDVLRQSMQTPGAQLDIMVGWPMSADYLALEQTVGPLYEKAQNLAQALQQKDFELEQSCLERNQIQVRGQAQLQQAKVQLEQAHLLIERSQQAQEKTATHNSQLQQQQQLLHSQLSTAQRERQNLIDHLQGIENSTVFRATRPLVHTKMWIDRQLGRTRQGAASPHTPLRHAMPASPEPVDIIVPVYRGLGDTRQCIESVLASPCKTPWRLVVINDASPEPEVTAWLRAKADEDPRITLLENETNLGFVGTVNRGMALSDRHDVLLLNSDTEVANDWLDRIQRAAYSDRRVASVTPFSNNATICSYPRFCQDNDLPLGMDTAQLDALCARTNPGAVVDVPTGVGFCMYIRRDCLADVGLFDTEHFGKGYGEENDFCQRAANAGWRNLHALDTFVLHTGGVSFGDSKSPRELAAMETLRRLHPSYETAVHQFVQADPAKPWRMALDLARVQAAHLPVVLAVLHDRAGGTVRHAHELASHLKDHARFLQLTPAGDGAVHLGLPGAQEALQLRFELPAQEERLVQLLRTLGVQHIHYHHLLGHSEAVRQLPARLGVTYDFTAHDYYSYCPQISLTDHTQAYCGEKGLDQCRQCLRKSPAPGGVTIETWRSNHEPFVQGARHVLVPSRDAARRMARFAPQADIRLAPHTDLPDPAALPTPTPRPLAQGAPLKIAVIGALSTIKGADLLEDAAQEAARRKVPLEFHLIGYGYRHLQGPPRARLTVHGQYKDEDLPSLLEWLQPDVVWFPAQWPETYSYTLSACLQAGLPIVAPDLGAFAERLAGRPWSWVHAWNTPAAQWVEWFTALRAQHFAVTDPLASAPTPPQTAPGTPEDARIGPWNYAQDYAHGLHALPTANAPRALELAAWIPAPQPSASRRQGLVSLLVRLRSAPGLRTVARSIPAHWQRQVKNWLLGHRR